MAQFGVISQPFAGYLGGSSSAQTSAARRVDQGLTLTPDQSLAIVWAFIQGIIYGTIGGLAVSGVVIALVLALRQFVMGG